MPTSVAPDIQSLDDVENSNWQRKNKAVLNTNLNVIGGLCFAPDVVTPEVFHCTETPDPLIFSRRHLPKY
jgi:hypothetical protein